MEEKNNLNEEDLGNLPEDIKEMALSEDTPIMIAYICSTNGIQDGSKIEKISFQTALVLAGASYPEDFQETLEVKAGLEKELAKKISQEIGQKIFYRIRASLQRIYSENESSEPQKIKSEIIQKSSGSDGYRESIK